VIKFITWTSIIPCIHRELSHCLTENNGRFCDAMLPLFKILIMCLFYFASIQAIGKDKTTELFENTLFALDGLYM
jgi:hypothetical protein